MKRVGLIFTALLICSVLYPSLCSAHLVNSGLGPFYDGALHLLLSFEDLLGIIAIAALGGMSGSRSGRLSVLFLAVFWLIAGTLGLRLFTVPEMVWLNTLSFAIPGLIVALNVKLPSAAVAALAGLFGFLHGLLNGSALATIGAGPQELLGIVAAVTVICLLVAAFVSSLKAVWAKIIVRVAGSWIAAVGMLMFGLLARTGL